MVSLIQIATSVVLPDSGLLINRKKTMGKRHIVAASTVNSKESCENFWISGKTETNMLSLSFFFFFGLCMCLKKITYTSGSEST